jgi:hypothetical protein
LKIYVNLLVADADADVVASPRPEPPDIGETVHMTGVSVRC